MNHWKFYITLGLVFLWCHRDVLNAQPREQVIPKYEAVIGALEQKDWNQVDKHAAEILKFIKDKEYDDLISVVSYMHIHALGGMMNEEGLSKKDAEKKAKVYKGKTLIMPGVEFRDKCYNCLFPLKEDKKKLFRTSSNHDNTSIYAFEYYEINEALDDDFIDLHSGKIMKIKARLREISTEGNMLPRFKLFFDQVEYYFLEEEKQETEESNFPFTDSLNTDFKYGISINTFGSQIQKFSEFRDKDGDVVTAILSGKFRSIKRTYVIRAIAYAPEADIKYGTEHLDSLAISINKQGSYEGLSLTRDAKVIEFPFFRGIDLCSKENEGSAHNYTISGVWVKDGRIFEISYMVTDTFGNEIFYAQERRNFDLFLNDLEITDGAKKEIPQNSKFGVERNKLLKNMSIGLDKLKCYEHDSTPNCLWIFVENISSYTLSTIKSTLFVNPIKHDQKGFIIPYTPDEPVILVFKSSVDTFEFPFTIPDLTK